jgi:hypothetical protein
MSKLAYLLLALVSFLGSSCALQEEPEVGLPDLVAPELIPASASVAYGNVFSLVALIHNVGEGTAQPHHIFVQVSYAIEGENYTEVVSHFVPIKEKIKPRAVQELHFEIMFSAPGYYKISTCSDGLQEVEESNETNNGDCQ